MPNDPQERYAIRFTPGEGGTGKIVMLFAQDGTEGGWELTLGAREFLTFVMQCREIAKEVSAHVEPQD